MLNKHLMYVICKVIVLKYQYLESKVRTLLPVGTAVLFRNFFAPGFPGLKEEASKCFEQSLGFACSVIRLSKPITLIHLSFSLVGILWKDSPYKSGIQFFTAHTLLVFLGVLCSVISEILIVNKG